MALGPAFFAGEQDMSAIFQDLGGDLRQITIFGRLDMEGTDAVSAQLMELVEAPKKAVVVDLSAVRFLASVGIGVLVAAAKAVQQRGGRLAIVAAPGSSVSMSLKATGIDELIPVFSDSTQAAEAALR
jgi:anti-sigma B factor antagonist